MATLDIIIYRIILGVLRGSKFTSASPGHQNDFIGDMHGFPEGGTAEGIEAAVLEIMQKGGDFDNDESSDSGTGDSDTINLDNANKLENDILDLGDKTVRKEVGKGTSEKLITSTVSKGVGVVQNPLSILPAAMSVLPHAAIVALALSLAPLIFEQLTRPGGPLDLRFKRIIDDEINAFLSRQTQKDTEMGIRQIVIQSKIGFTATSGANHYNTVKGIREGGIDEELIERVGMVDHTKGVFETG